MSVTPEQITTYAGIYVLKLMDLKPADGGIQMPVILDAKLAIEVDGRLEGWRTRNHTSDSRKCAVLLAQGWRVHRVPNKRLNRRDDIAEVVDEVLAILASLRGTSGGASDGRRRRGRSCRRRRKSRAPRRGAQGRGAHRSSPSGR